MFIIIKDSKRRHDKCIDLNEYALFWLPDQHKKYHCFQLKSQSLFSRYPSFLVGSADETLAKSWYDYLLVAKNTYFSQNIQTMENNQYFNNTRIQQLLSNVYNNQNNDIYVFQQGCHKRVLVKLSLKDEDHSKHTTECVVKHAKTAVSPTSSPRQDGSSPSFPVIPT